MHVNNLMGVYFLFKVLKIVLNLKLRKPAEAVNGLLMAGRAGYGEELQRQRNGVIFTTESTKEIQHKGQEGLCENPFECFVVKLLLEMNCCWPGDQATAKIEAKTRSDKKLFIRSFSEFANNGQTDL